MKDRIVNIVKSAATAVKGFHIDREFTRGKSFIWVNFEWNPSTRVVVDLNVEGRLLREKSEYSSPPYFRFYAAIVWVVIEVTGQYGQTGGLTE